MFSSIRRAVTSAALVAAAVGAVVAAAPAANAADAVPDIPSTFFGGTSDGTVVVALSSQVMSWDLDNVLNAASICNYDSQVGVGLNPQIARYRTMDAGECVYLLRTCALPAKDAGRNGGITMFTDPDGTRHYHCWSYSPQVTSMQWHQPKAPALTPPSAADAQWQVLDLSDPKHAQESKPSITLSDRTSARVSGSWFVTSAGDKAATESQSQLLTYVDWFGTKRTAWAQPTGDGGYNFVTFQSSQGIFNGNRVLQPEYCKTSGLCHVTNSIQYVGPDGHRYQAGLKVLAPTS